MPDEASLTAKSTRFMIGRRKRDASHRQKVGSVDKLTGIVATPSGSEVAAGDTSNQVRSASESFDCQSRMNNESSSLATGSSQLIRSRIVDRNNSAAAGGILKEGEGKDMSRGSVAKSFETQSFGRMTNPLSQDGELSQFKSESTSRQASLGRSFDFRPVEIQNQVPAIDSLDPSWDANKVYFSEYDSRKSKGKKKTVIDVFKVSPNSRDRGVFEKSGVASIQEEKKERDIDAFAVYPAEDDGELDPLGWPRDNLQSQQSPVPATQDLYPVDRDDEDLLSGKLRSEDDFDQRKEDSIESRSFLKQQRIIIYERKSEDSSSEVDAESQSFENDEFNSEEIGYISQESDSVEDSTLCFEGVSTSNLGHDNAVQLVVPAFDETIVAVAKSELRVESSPLAGSFLPLPPPALSVVKLRKEKSRGQSAVPLLPPPPAEKFQKWKDNKAKAIDFVQRKDGRGAASSNPALILAGMERPGTSIRGCDEKRILESFSFASWKETDATYFDYSSKHEINDTASQTKNKDASSNLQHQPETSGERGKKAGARSPRYRFPDNGTSPFVIFVGRTPNLLSNILGYLGDPVAVCRVKMVNKACFNFIDSNAHRLMRDAVRLGGMSKNVRPYFWLWVSLSRVGRDHTCSFAQLSYLEKAGREGRWHHVIERDVSRAFGNLPPHKTGARLRTDSIVRALVTWGRSRILKRGVKGSGEAPPPSRTQSSDSDEVSLAPTETVSDWGGVTPVGSFASSTGSDEKAKRASGSRQYRRRADEEMALSGNALTEDMKVSLQHKLSFILHALAASHEDVGYCQGMDYVVAHLLRILQDTIRWMAATGSLPHGIASAPSFLYKPPFSDQELAEIYAEVDRSQVVEETCFRVMDSFFTSYNLRHFYWPELRCLKTCCLVFEKLIQIKLPVLADHFEHHELNVGLFALGWFQTLFLYLPSMPSATVCHMWDIYLVERSFKIFFRVGTAILFLSQPILLNQELEGMMSYLNTFPDATLLSPDILIACALQIKVTNRLLMELEKQVSEVA